MIEGVDATLTNSYSVINENNIGQMDAKSIVKVFCQISTVTFKDP